MFMEIPLLSYYFSINSLCTSFIYLSLFKPASFGLQVNHMFDFYFLILFTYLKFHFKLSINHSIKDCQFYLMYLNLLKL